MAVRFPAVLLVAVASGGQDAQGQAMPSGIGEREKRYRGGPVKIQMRLRGAWLVLTGQAQAIVVEQEERPPAFFDERDSAVLYAMPDGPDPTGPLVDWGPVDVGPTVSVPG